MIFLYAATVSTRWSGYPDNPDHPPPSPDYGGTTVFQYFQWRLE